MCTVTEFIEVFEPYNGPIERGQIWQDMNGNRVQVIYSDGEGVQFIRETVWKYTSGKNGFQKYGELNFSFFLHIFSPVLKSEL